MKDLLQNIYQESKQAAEDLCEKAHLKPHQIVVVGCSSSEVGGNLIGTHSSPEIAQAIFHGLYEVFSQRQIYMAAQCCEHLNRAIIIEREAASFADIVNVIPQPKAGGSFATMAYHTFKHPVVVEEIRGDAGLDIGGTLIGMHLKKVIPQPKAGGSFATMAYHTFKHPVVVEEIRGDAGLDIGGTLIGMHLKKVAVPIRLSLDHIGHAILLAARTRPKFIGGSRALYDDTLL